MPPSHASTADSKPSASSGGVQSLERAFDLLERMADAGGEVGLSELSASSGLPLPTIHRLMRTLVVCGYVRQQPNRRYALGPRLIRLGESASRLLGTWARPYLSRLVEETGETANMALLDGDEIVYVAQVPSKHSMRMFTEVGRRVLPHSTGVGKALLARHPRRRGPGAPGPYGHAGRHGEDDHHAGGLPRRPGAGAARRIRGGRQRAGDRG
ncbi:IclR family transcriptional regulator, acetate operon repressor, partial [Streptomyces sp. Ncost-T6T-2b]